MTGYTKKWYDEYMSKRRQSFPAQNRHVERRSPEGEGDDTPEPEKLARPLQIAHASPMNKTEKRYAQEVLDPRVWTGELVTWKFEAVKLKLAYRTWYTPDFWTIAPDGRMEMIEIKGFLQDDAAVKYKIAREAFPIFEWRMIRRVKGEWVEVRI